MAGSGRVGLPARFELVFAEVGAGHVVNAESCLNMGGLYRKLWVEAGCVWFGFQSLWASKENDETAGSRFARSKVERMNTQLPPKRN